MVRSCAGGEVNPSLLHAFLTCLEESGSAVRGQVGKLELDKGSSFFAHSWLSLPTLFGRLGRVPHMCSCVCAVVASLARSEELTPRTVRPNE